ncbi:hypothetical protein B0H10DRAFT_1941264 [Mycena sp. CBHHK59/15]|nr:hypothetical protein B0H10DRAFT_1941264 [Mycena sp. CBHHK59/15]
MSHERQHAETIGEGVQLLFGSSDTTKTVRTQADWITAWSKDADATLFVFPHRRHELQQYHQYIMDFFISSADHVYKRIILLDCKLRNEVAGRHDIELCDFTQFSHWVWSFVSDHGTAYLTFKPKAKGSNRRAATSHTGSSGGSVDKKSPEP